MDVLKELTKLLESQKRVAIGKSRGPAKIGQSVNVEISSSLLGKRGVVRAIALTPISSSGIEVGLTIDERKRIVAVAKAQEEKEKDVIINDRWGAEEKPKPEGSSKAELGGVVLFGALKEVAKPNAIPDCTCPTLNYAQPTAGDKQFKSCKEEPELSQDNLGAIAAHQGAAETFFYASHFEGDIKDQTPGLPYGWSGNYGNDNLYWLPSINDTGGFTFNSGTHRGISYYKSNNKIEGGDLLIYSYFHTERVIVIESGLREGTLNLLFGGDYSKYFQETSNLSDEDKAAVLVDLTPVVNQIGETKSTYVVRDLNNSDLKSSESLMTLKVAEYREYWWQIFENHWDVNSPLIKTFKVAVTELRKRPPEVLSGPSFDRLRLGIDEYDFRIKKTGAVNLGPVPKSGGSGGSGGGGTQDPQQFFDEEGATLGSNKYYNTEFYIGGFTQNPYKLPYTLRADDPHKATIDRIGPNHYQIVIISGTHQMTQTKENGDYLIKHAPWMVGDTWDYLINEAPNDPDSTGGEVRKSSNFRACEAHVFVVSIFKEVVTVEKNEHYSYPDEIPNYGESFKDNWYSFVLNKHREHTFFNYFIGPFTRYFAQQDELGSNKLVLRGDHRFTLNSYRGTIRFTQFVDYKDNTPIGQQGDLNSIGDNINYTYPPNTVKEMLGVGVLDLDAIFPQFVNTNPELKKYKNVKSLFLDSYLLWLESNKPNEQGFSKINPFYWLNEEDYFIKPNGVSTSSYPGNYYLYRIFEKSPNELVSACRLAVTDFKYPLVYLNTNWHPNLETLPSTTERSNWLIDNSQITYGLTFNITDLWQEGALDLGSSVAASLSDTTIRGFGTTNQSVGTQGNLEIPCGFFIQQKENINKVTQVQHKEADIEIYKSRTRLFNFNLKCEARDLENCSLGTALYTIGKQEDPKHKILATVIDFKHEFIESYGEATYENNNSIFKLNSNGTASPVSNGKYSLKTETFDIVKLNKIDTELLTPSGTPLFMPDYTLKTISLYPIRQPDFYAICLFGMQSYDDKIKESTPEEEE